MEYLESTMTASEFDDWWLYYQSEPWGFEGQNILGAWQLLNVAAMLGNKDVPLEAFMLKLDEESKGGSSGGFQGKDWTQDQWAGFFRFFARMHNGG